MKYLTRMIINYYYSFLNINDIININKYIENKEENIFDNNNPNI